MFAKPIFKKSDEEKRQFILLKEAVRDHLSFYSDDYSNQIKAFLLPFLYMLFWFAAMQFKFSPILYYTFYSLMGIFMILIFINLIHEACHQTLFKKRWQNQIILHLLDCVGANSFIWSKRHIKMHHNYPNTIGRDSDIEQGGPIKVFPSDAYREIQKYQHYLIFFLYPFFLLNWLLIRDFKDFYSSKRYIRKICEIPLKEHFKLWFFKLFFFSYTILIPIFVFDVEIIQAIFGFLLQMILGSLFGLIVLLPPHANINNEFPVPNEKSMLSNTWLRHQFITTNDVRGNNIFYKYLMNNFNCHLAHHLFPNMKAGFTNEITNILKEFAKNHNLPYKSYSLFTAFKLHYQLIKRNAIRPQNIFEETM